MIKASKFSTFLLATLASVSFARTVNAQSTTTPTTTATTANLTVRVTGLRNQNGQVCARIFDDRGGFPLSDTGVVRSSCTRTTGSSVTLRFNNLRLGNYAMTGFHDENRDGNVNISPAGLPSEGVFIYINPSALPLTGVPTFQQGSFSVRQNRTITIPMAYFPN